MVTTLELYIFTSSSIIKFIKSLRLYIPLLKRNRIEETFQRAIFTLTKILQKLFYFKLYIWRDPSYKKKKKKYQRSHEISWIVARKRDEWMVFDIEIYKSYLNFNFESKNLLIPFSLPIKFTDIFRRRALKREGSMAEFFLDTILPRGRPIENT